MRKSIVIFLLFCSFAAAYCMNQTSRDGDVCLECHKNKFNPPEQFIHPLIKQAKCAPCHSSYNIVTHREGVKPTIDACIVCHAQEKLGRSHPVGGGIIDPNTGSEMTCVSTCHLPHGTGYKYELPFKDSMELCLSCHKDF